MMISNWKEPFGLHGLYKNNNILGCWDISYFLIPKSYTPISVVSGCGYALPASCRDKPHPAINIGVGLGSKYPRLGQMLCL